MHLKYLLVIFLISLFLIKQVIIANTSEPALDKLIYDYKQAHSQKNIDAVLALYYWDGVDEKIKKSVFNNHKRYLDYKITSIRVAKAPLQEYNPFILEGKKYRTNLKVTKVLKVKFENTKTTKEVTIPIGIKDSKYYFVTARPDK
ncbi:MAG: hypothetical protein HY819_16830 [Acidobacteria bacterium]|nr:hypothetical protein [Acidobacteriota bacterium]